MGTHPIFESDFDCLTECKTHHEVWPVMHCDKIMVALLDEIDSAERVFKCSFAVKTQLGALEASLQQSTLGDSRDKDLSSSTIKTNKVVDGLLNFTCTATKSNPTSKTTPKQLRIKTLKHYRNADPLAQIAYASGPNLLLLRRPSQKRNFEI